MLPSGFRGVLSPLRCPRPEGGQECPSFPPLRADVRPACVCELRLACSNWKADPSGPLQCLDLTLWDMRSKCLLRL